MQDQDDTPTEALVRKFARRKKWDDSNARALVLRVVANVSALEFPLTPSLRHHMFEIVHNALPTRRRMSFFGGPTTCRLCHGEEESMDHLHSHCPASLRARTLISSLSFDRSAVSSLLAATPEDLRFEGVGHSPDAALCFLLYSSAVWRTAKHYSDSPSPPSTVKAAWGIARRFLSSQSYLRKGNSRIKAKLKKGKKQIEEVNSLLKEKAPCLVVATDGSSLGNPGPAGGGFLIKELGFGRNAVVAQKSIALGVGTNYFAELSALDAALEEVTLNPPGVSRPIIFLVDNENTLKVAKGTTFSSRYPALAWVGPFTGKLLLWRSRVRLASFGFLGIWGIR